MDVRTLNVEAFTNRKLPVLYMRINHQVFFTGLNRFMTSTISACEFVMQDIAKEIGAGTHLVFYDVQTQIGYQRYEAGDLCIDRIGYDENDSLVWHNLINTRYGRNESREVPRVSLEFFRPWIGGAASTSASRLLREA